MIYSRMRMLSGVLLASALTLTLSTAPLFAADFNQSSTPSKLVLSTPFPAQVIGMDESPTLPLKLHTNDTPQIVKLAVQDLPTGWDATFHGSNHMVSEAFVAPDSDVSLDLKLALPQDVKAGDYQFAVKVDGSNGDSALLPLAFTIKDKLPPKLEMDVKLPTLKGKPNTTFRYDVTLKNDGDEDMTVNLSAEAPNNIAVTFNWNGQEVTDLPVAANESKSLSVEAKPNTDLAAGTYNFTFHAQGGDVEASTQVSAEVVGVSSISVSAPDGRLSGDAYAGKDTPFKVVVQNTGTAPARGIQLKSSNPTGWNVTFDPKAVDEIDAGKSVEVTAQVHPTDKAVAGDYMVNVSANTADGSSKSVDFRITVLTSTLWGITGVALIAIALGSVGLAVARFGRR